MSRVTFRADTWIRDAADAEWPERSPEDDGLDRNDLCVERFAEALRACGVRLSCKEVPHRSGGTAVAATRYMTDHPIEDCVARVQMLRKVAGVSQWPVRQPTTADTFAARDLGDACLQSHVIKRTRPAAPHARAATIEDMLGAAGKRPRRQGFWVFCNQTEFQDWPTWDDGPFREAWAEASVDAACFYGRAQSTRWGEVPFAIVETAEPYCVSTSQRPVGYRFCGRGHTFGCPRAAYCWAAGALTDTPPASGGGLTLLDLTAAGGEFIVCALLSLSQHIEKEFAAHDAKGAFTRRAEPEGRRASVPAAVCGSADRELATGRGLTTAMASAPVQAPSARLEGLDRVSRIAVLKFKGWWLNVRGREESCGPNDAAQAEDWRSLGEANGTTSYRILPGDHDEAEKDFSNTNMHLYARFWKSA